MQPSGKNKITVDFDADGGAATFMISCPPWCNEYLAGLPNRRWNKRARMWFVPMIRKNVDFLREGLMEPGYAEFTPKAKRAIKEATAKLAAPRVKGGFPSWYRFKTTPRKHQTRALEKLYPIPHSAMFMDRGTGKTKTTIDIACARRMEGLIDCLLVACKLSGRRTWEEEFAIHSPIDASIHLPYTDSKSGERAFDKWLRHQNDMKVMVIGLESLSAGRMAEWARKFLNVHSKPMMVIDESHMIANHRAIRSVNCVKLGHAAHFRSTLTGTPISTGPMNLFMQFEFLDPDIIGIGDFYSFRNRYAVMGGYRNDRGKPMQIVGYQNIDELTRTVAPYVFEVRKSDALDLPPKVFKKVHVQLTKEQRALYDEIKKKQAYEAGGKEMVVSNVLELALRLQQVAGGFITHYEVEERKGKQVRRSVATAIVPWQKNPKIMELMDIAADGKQMIIWCAYKAEIEAVVTALNHHFPKDGVGQIHGGIDEEDRDRYRHEFQKKKIRFLVGNTTTGGASLTLTACEIMVYFNNTEKLIDREQSEDRAHRDGLKHSVLYIDLVAEKTVDETVIRSLGNKLDLSEYIRQNIARATALLDGA